MLLYHLIFFFLTHYSIKFIYDIMNENMSFSERTSLLHTTFEGQDCPNLVLVPTYEVNNEEEIKQYHEQFIQE